MRRQICWVSMYVIVLLGGCVNIAGVELTRTGSYVPWSKDSGVGCRACRRSEPVRVSGRGKTMVHVNCMAFSRKYACAQAHDIPSLE
jgi:hypothetical protein